jgi:hypothetical protein
MDDALALDAAYVARLSGPGDRSFEAAVTWLLLSGRVARSFAPQRPASASDDLLGNLSDEEWLTLRHSIDTWLAEQAEVAA